MRNYPEWILSTPRLILVVITLGLIVFTFNGTTEPTIFKDIALVVFGYFFGSRGSETTKNIQNQEIPNDSKPILEDKELEFISQKFNDNNQQ